MRELQNLVEGAVSLAEGSISSELLRSLMGGAGEEAGEPIELEAVERRHIQRVIRLADGNKSTAARLSASTAVPCSARATETAATDTAAKCPSCGNLSHGPGAAPNQHYFRARSALLGGWCGILPRRREAVAMPAVERRERAKTAENTGGDLKIFRGGGRHAEGVGKILATTGTDLSRRPSC